MNKIFITAHSLEIGGAERALLGLLENFDYSRYQVDLFLLRHTGELMPFIPREVHILPESPAYSCLGIPMTIAFRKGYPGVCYGRFLGKYIAKQRIKQLKINGDNNVLNEYSHKYTVGWLPNMSEENFDLAISFMSPHYFVTKKVKAKKKIAWIHTDYKTFQVDIDSEQKMWGAYDGIVSISEDVTDSFLETFPLLKDKIIEVENIIPISIIEKQADAFSVEAEMPSDGSVKMLTIGRFTYPKRMDEIPEICRLIRDKGIDLKWYLIGYGGEEIRIRQSIQETGMQEYVRVLGKKENPYPYIKACDVYAQPSRYEGKSIAVREAQILHKPVIITDFSTSHSQLEDGVDGVIVPMELHACAEAMTNILKDRERMQFYAQNTWQRDYVGKQEIRKLYALLED